jgi:uncharacterized protein (TIGR02246 family)
MFTALKSKPVPPTGHNAVSPEEREIRELIAKWRAALEAKDLDGLAAGYADDAVLFDVKPPYKLQGPAAIRATWEQCLPYFPRSFKSEHRDLKIDVNGSIAFVHGLHHITPTDEPNHPAGQSWIRVTACYRKVNGRWLVAHEHVSMPFDCATGSIAPITNPDAVK